MTQATTLKLDKSRPYSECHGERAPDDPHYRVRFWQGQRVKGDMVMLPFDARGELVPDDGKKETWQGLVDGKPVTHYPLYNDAMRAMLEKKTKSAAAAVQEPEAEDEPEEDRADASDDVNFESWLRGEARYEPHLIRAAAKKRYSKNYQKLSELVVDLVLDEKLVPEDEVCPALAGHLKPKAA